MKDLPAGGEMTAFCQLISFNRRLAVGSPSWASRLIWASERKSTAAPPAA